MSLEEKERECSLSLSLSLFFVWAQLGSNQRPPDYESGAANHLSYGPEITGCKYNIKLNYLQTLYNSVTATRYLKVFHNHIYAMLYPAG